MSDHQFTTRRGDTWPGFTLTVTATDPVNDPVNFIGSTASGDIREKPDGPRLLSAVVDVDAAADSVTLTVSLPAAKTAHLQGVVVGDVELVLADGRVFTPVDYELTVTRDVTRPGAEGIGTPTYQGSLSASSVQCGPLTATISTIPIPITPGSPGGTAGEVVHNDTLQRDAANAHPTSAITGLDAALAAKAAAADLTAHTGNTSNPHVVTAAQVGADVAGAAATVQTNLNAHTARTDNPHSTTAAQVGADPAGSSAAVQANLTAHTSAANPHSGSASTASLTAHTGNTSNPHAVTAVQVGADVSGAAAAVQTNLNTHTGTAAIHVPSGGTDGQALTKVSGVPAWANQVILESPTVKRIKVDDPGTSSDTLYIITT